MKNILKKIKKSKLMETFENEYVLELYKSGKIILSEFLKNNILHYEGDYCEKLEIILTGRVIIERIDEEGALLSIAEFKENDLIGGNLIYSKNPIYPMTITAKENTTLLGIPRDELMTLLSFDNNFLLGYLEYISDNAYIISGKLRDNTARSLRKRIISYLEYESKQQSSTEITLRKSKKSIAENFGVQRTSLSRELKKMKDEGLIDYNSKTLWILDDLKISDA